jgi:7,8-dihydro-6-hydroxymethylpterin-pyrophosphokinase
MNPKALVHVYVKAFEGQNRLKEKIFNLRKHVKIIAASSAYKRKRLEDSGFEFLEIVLQIDGCADGIEYFEISKKTEVDLLLVEGELRLDPALTIPNPKLQLDPFVLHLAAECAPYWEHRVKKKSLLELDQESVVEEPVEFLTQGQALINF